jgi:uncharacterized protein (DUF58 family)
VFGTGKKPRPAGPAAVVHKKPSRDFSLTGLVYCSMMMFMGLAAVNSQANLLFGVFGLMIGILLVSVVVSGMVLRKLTVRRDLPEHGVVGRPMAISYEMSNRKRFWPSLAVSVAELDSVEAFGKQPMAYMMHAAGRTSDTISAPITPKRRGLHHLDHHQVLTSFPFGFIRRAVLLSHKDSLLIYPAIAQVDQKMIQMCQSAETSGSMMRPRRGGADEFYGVKEFRTGENPRWIYWRRSARTGTLVSKEMTHVSPPRFLLMVDTYISQRTEQTHAAVEHAIAMAASMASDMLQQGLPIGLLVWSNKWIYLPPNRGKRHARDVLSVLAQLPLNQQFERRALLDEGYRIQKAGTTALLVTPSQMQLSLGQHARGNMFIFSPDSPRSQRLFRFENAVDFAHCMPADQEIEERMKAKG